MPPISLSINHWRAQMHVEELEPRLLLSWSQPTDLEQVFLERLNDARANPAAYGASIGVDLSGVAPSPPLALNPYLTGSAQLHSQDMNNRGYFDHTDPDGLSPLDRMRASGFSPTSWAESIAAGYANPDAALKGLIQDTGVPDLGHRRQLLAIDPAYQGLNQTGIGITFGSGPYGSYYTIDSAAGSDSRPFITGVVFRDGNGNGRYDAGEGIGNITITVVGAGTTSTWNAGGYSIQVNPGTYQVVASGPGLATPVVQTVTVGSTNARLNFNLASPPPPYYPTPSPPIQAPVTPVVTVNDAAGRPVVFVQGLDDQVYLQHLDANGSPVGGYVLAGVGQVKTFAVGHDGWGNPEVFAIGLNDAVFTLKFDGNDNPVGGYNGTSDNRVEAIAAGHDAWGEPELFALGMDSQVYALKFDGAGNPVGTYFLTAAGQVKSFAVGNDAWGEPEVFVIGLNDMVFADKLDGNGYPGPGYFLTSQSRVKALTVGHDAFNDPEVFAIGLNDLVFIQRFDAAGNPQGDYNGTCNFPVKAIRIGYDAFNRPELFAIGFDDQVYAEVFNPDGSAQGACLLSRPGQIKSVAAGRDAAGRPELFVIGLDDQVYAQPFDAAGNSVGNYYLTAPGQVK